MTYLFSQYWIFIALAVVLGLFVGWATRGGGPRSAGGWVGWAIAWFLVGLFVALFKWLPGLAGHLLEVALMLFAAFVIGCIAGCGARGAVGGDDAGAHGHDAAGHGHVAPASGAATQSGAAPIAHTHEDLLGVDSSASYPGVRPAAAAAGAKADDLTQIAGVDSGTAKALGDIGVSQYSQIGGWGAPQTSWVEHHLAQPGRVGRENWIAQARNLASGKAPAIAAAAAAAAGGIAATASGAAGSATSPTSDAKTATSPAKAGGGETPGAAGATTGVPAAVDAKAGATASAQGAGDAAPAGASTGAAASGASAGAAQASAPTSTAGGDSATHGGAPAQPVTLATVSGASSGDHDTTASAPPPGMTDGQRSILAAREKMAAQAGRAATLAAAATAGGAALQGSAETAPVAAPTAARALDSAPRANMTDGQRSILAARQRMAEKSARATGTVAGGTGVDGAGAGAASATSAAAPGAGDSRPAADSEPYAPADDLKLIKGIGPKNEAALNGLGVRRFAQIADWTPENANWVGHSIRFPGRIEREHWIPQARFLAAGVDTPHSAAVKSGAIRIDDSADAPMSDAEADAVAKSLPQQAAKVENEQSYAGARPLGLAGPRGGKADDLKLIKGIGRQNEERLHALGVWHFDQIAAWSVENVKWIGSYLAFPGRIDREGWLAQAHTLARGEKTEFAKRVEAGDVPTSNKLI